jgi:hypothetical protein
VYALTTREAEDGLKLWRVGEWIEQVVEVIEGVFMVVSLAFAVQTV